MDGQPTTRAKFRCDEVTLTSYGTKILLSAVSPDKAKDGYEHGEDHAFWNATPTGSLTMQINNPYGAELFQPGKTFYLDFTEAPA